MSESASKVIAEVIEQHTEALAMMIRSLAKESEKSAKRGNGGKLFGQALGILILIATFIGETDLESLQFVRGWIPFAVGIMGIAVTVTGQYINPEGRMKLAQASSDLASKIRVLRNKVRVDVASIDQSDDGKMQALLEQLQDTENGIFQDARSAGINSDISLILDQRFASKSTIFERMAGN